MQAKRAFALFKGIKPCRYGFACRDCFGSKRSIKSTFHRIGKKEMARVLDRVERIESEDH